MGVFLFGSEQGERLRRADKSHARSDPIRVIPAKFPMLYASRESSAMPGRGQKVLKSI